MPFGLTFFVSLLEQQRKKLKKNRKKKFRIRNNNKKICLFNKFTKKCKKMIIKNSTPKLINVVWMKKNLFKKNDEKNANTQTKKYVKQTTASTII